MSAWEADFHIAWEVQKDIQEYIQELHEWRKGLLQLYLHKEITLY